MPSPILINPDTEKALSLFSRHPNSPLMLAGSEGAGKLFLAKNIASEVLNLNSKMSLEQYPYYLHIQKMEGKQDVSIEQIREAIKFLRLKAAGRQSVRRVILISDAQNMNAEAQNALLKVLEEPNSDTLFILTITTPGSIAPTVISRCQVVEIKPVSLGLAFSFFGPKHSKTEIESNWRISKGAVGLLCALLSSKADHPLKQAVERAKRLLSLPKYQRLLELEGAAKDKQSYVLLLDGLSLVLDALHSSSISKNDKFQSKFLSSRRLVLKLKVQLAANCSLKLISDELALKLSV